MRCAFCICVISPKTAAIFTVNGQCGTTSLTWTLEKYGSFSHSRNLPWKQCPAIYLLPFIIQASAHGYSAHWFYFYLFFPVVTKGMESRKLHKLFRNEIVFRPTDQCASHLSAVIFYLKKYWGFPKLRNRLPSLFLLELPYFFEFINLHLKQNF